MKNKESSKKLLINQNFSEDIQESRNQLTHQKALSTLKIKETKVEDVIVYESETQSRI